MCLCIREAIYNERRDYLFKPTHNITFYNSGRNTGNECLLLNLVSVSHLAAEANKRHTNLINSKDTTKGLLARDYFLDARFLGSLRARIVSSAISGTNTLNYCYRRLAFLRSIGRLIRSDIIRWINVDVNAVGSIQELYQKQNTATAI